MQLKRSYYLFEFFIIAHILTIIGRDLYYNWFYPDLIEEKNLAEQQNYGSIFTLMFLYVIKYKQEGFRYNAFLIFFMEIFIIFCKIRSISNYIYQYGTLLLLFIYIFDIIMHPTYQLYNDQYRYPLGFKQMQLNDLNKTELAIFYPSVKTKYNGIKWITQTNFANQLWDYLKMERKLSKRVLLLPKFLFKLMISFFEFVQVQVQYSAQLAEIEGHYKIGIFSHGIPGHRLLHSTFISELVSNGYIIIALEHKDEVILNCQKGVFNPSDPGYQQQELSQREKQQELRMQQINALIESLHNKNTSKLLFEKEVKLDLDNLFVIGDLEGGGSALCAALINEKVKGCIAIDPILQWIPEALLNKPTDKPVLFIQSEQVVKSSQNAPFIGNSYALSQKFFQTNKATIQNKMMCYIKNTSIYNFSDMAFVLPFELQLIRKIKNYKEILNIFVIYTKIVNLFLNRVMFASLPKQPVNKKTLIYDNLNMYLKSYDLSIKSVVRVFD